MKKYESYKDSGIEWIGEIPSHWEVRKLKFVVKYILGGGTPNSLNSKYWSDKLNENSYLWVSIADITNSEYIQDTKKYITKEGLKNSSAKIVPPYSILYSIYASLGKVAYSNKELTTNQAILSIILKSEYYYKFIFYYLKTLTQIAIHLSNSTTQDNISLEILKNLYILTPPLPEQKQIASFLDEKVDKIEKAISKKEKLIKLLKEQKQIIINEAVTKGIDKNVEYKDSGVEWIGKIPKHWEVRKLKFLLRLCNDKVEIKNHKVIALENLNSWNGKFIETNSKYQGEGVLFKENDILFGKLRPYLAKVYHCEEKGVAFGDLLVYRPIKEIYSKYSFYYMISSDFIKIVDSSTYGTKMPRASVDFINNLEFVFPPLPEQQKIVSYIEEKISKIDNLIQLQQKQIEKLKEYKTILIDEVVTGKIKVCNNKDSK